MTTYKDTFLLVDKVTKPLQRMSVALKKAQVASEKVNKRFEKITKRLNYLGNAFKKAGGRISGFVAKLGLSFTGLTSAIGLAFNRLQSWFSQTAEAGDRIDKMSQKIGMSRKSFQEWDFIMSQNGGSVDNLAMGFKTLSNQMNGVKKGSKESIKAFNALGVSVTNSNGAFRSQDDVFNDVIRALQKEKNETKKAILGNQLFGRSFIEMRPLLNQTAESIDELRKQAQDTLILEEDIDNARDFKDAMDRLTRTFQAKMAPIITRLMPKVIEIMDKISKRTDIIKKIIGSIIWLTDRIVKLVDWFMNLSKGGKIAIGIIIGIVAAIGPLLSGIGSLIMILGTFGITAGTATAALGGFIATAWTAAAPFLAVAGAVWVAIKAIEKLIGKIIELKGKKIDGLNLENQDNLAYLAQQRESMGAKAFNKKYNRKTQKAVQSYSNRQSSTSTVNNNTSTTNNYYGNTYNNSNSNIGRTAQYVN